MIGGRNWGGEILMIANVVHFMPQGSNLSFEPLDAHNILIPHHLMILTNRVIPVAPLAWTLPIASDLGRSAIDAGIDSASFARPLA
jgi:hypothetical protein